MYQVNTYHRHPEIKNGDTEATTELKATNTFKTRKEAKNWMVAKSRERQYASVKEMWSSKEPSYIYCFTEKIWLNEGSGYNEQEYYFYKLQKI